MAGKVCVRGVARGRSHVGPDSRRCIALLQASLSQSSRPLQRLEFAKEFGSDAAAAILRASPGALHGGSYTPRAPRAALLLPRHPAVLELVLRRSSRCC